MAKGDMSGSIGGAGNAVAGMAPKQDQYSVMHGIMDRLGGNNGSFQPPSRIGGSGGSSMSPSQNFQPPQPPMMTGGNNQQSPNIYSGGNPMSGNGMGPNPQLLQQFLQMIQQGGGVR